MAEKDTATKTGPKPVDCVLVQHLQRYADSRSLRAERKGHRRQGVLLSDGTRIRRKNYRFTEMSMALLEANHHTILEHMREGRLAVFTVNGDEMTYDQVLKLLEKNLGAHEVKQDSAKDMVYEKVTTPEIGIARPEDITRPDMDAAAVTAAVDQVEAEKAGTANPPPSKRAEEPVAKRSGKRSKS